MDVHDIQSVWSNIDLQVTVDSTLKFLLHINNMCSEASKQANLLLRCFKSANLELRNSAFKVYVRPVLEYFSLVWNPCTMKDIKTLA